MQRLLVWHSGDEDGLQSQRFGVQIQVSAKKKKNWGGGRSRDRVRGSIGLGIGIGIGESIGFLRNWDRVRCGGERVTLFEKHFPPPKKKVENHLVKRKLTS